MKGLDFDRLCELILSVIVLIGSGILRLLLPTDEMIGTMTTASVTAVITFWFARSQATISTNGAAKDIINKVEALLTAPPNTKPQL